MTLLKGLNWSMRGSRRKVRPSQGQRTGIQDGEWETANFTRPPSILSVLHLCFRLEPFAFHLFSSQLFRHLPSKTYWEACLNQRL